MNEIRKRYMACERCRGTVLEIYREECIHDKTQDELKPYGIMNNVSRFRCLGCGLENCTIGIFEHDSGDVNPPIEDIPYDNLTTEHIKANIAEMNANEMHEIDQMVMMIDTQRSIINMLQRGECVDDLIESVISIEMPNQSHRYKDMFDAAVEYYLLLQDANGADPLKKERLKKKLDELSAPFSYNQAYFAFLSMERMAAGMGKSKQVIRSLYK